MASVTDYGIFTQSIDMTGRKRESASTWLRLHNVWETPRSDARTSSVSAGAFSILTTLQGLQRSRWVETQDVLAIGFDQLVPGNRSPTVNHLRLWSARALQPFHIEDFNAGNYPAAVEDQVAAKNLSRVLYPDDSTPQARNCGSSSSTSSSAPASRTSSPPIWPRSARWRSCQRPGRADERHASPRWRFPSSCACWWTVRHALGPSVGYLPHVFGYTNHTLMPEALETWPVHFFEQFLPRHLEIITASTRNSCSRWRSASRAMVRRRPRCPSLVNHTPSRVRMSHLAVVGSHKVNGVAQAAFRSHAEDYLLGFARMFPDRFTNVTNGITVRRWLKQSNPRLARLLTERLGSALGKRSRGNRTAALGRGRSCVSAAQFR
jgi:starch phosphorylase